MDEFLAAHIVIGLVAMQVGGLLCLFNHGGYKIFLLILIGIAAIGNVVTWSYRLRHKKS
jgi:hypothetical protein